MQTVKRFLDQVGARGETFDERVFSYCAKLNLAGANLIADDPERKRKWLAWWRPNPDADAQKWRKRLDECSCIPVGRGFYYAPPGSLYCTAAVVDQFGAVLIGPFGDALETAGDGDLERVFELYRPEVRERIAKFSDELGDRMTAEARAVQGMQELARATP